MRKLLITICIALLITPLMLAQQRTGTIYGKIVDEEGTPLPGVTTTLDSELIREISSFTSNRGLYRFVGLPPGKDYKLTARLAGFKTETLSNIIVRIDSNTEINITMRIGAIEEEVTVTALSPIVDIKTTKVSHNVDREILQSIPSARDPWVMAQMAPGVVMDRENVGGSESGQQSDMIVRGQTGGQTTYNIDGMNITDPDAIGASPGYYDFDSFEEIDFTLGGADVTQAQAGINLNIVTRRAGNRPSVGGRVFWTEGGFQANKDDYVEKVQADNPGFDGIPQIRDLKDFGINVGAPIIQDKLWAWMYFGVQDIRTVTAIGNDDDTYLQNMGLKINAQIVPENRAEIYFSFGKKNKWGRGASFSFPDGYFQGEPQHFGNPIHKFQDEHMFGNNLFVSAKYVYANVGFSLTPMSDRDFVKVPWYDSGAEVWKAPGPLGGTPAGYRRSLYMRPVKTAALRTTYFNDDLFGASHEILVGFEFNDRSGVTDSEREGHMDVTYNYSGDVADFDGDGSEDPAPSPYFMLFDVDRYNEEEGIVRHYQAYIRDTISFGNFTILAGLRYDYQNPISGIQNAVAVYDHPVWYGDDAIATPEVRDFIETFLPPAGFTENRQVTAFEGGNYNWQDIAPRLGITWDMFGDGKTIAKLSFSRYTNFMDIDVGENWRMPGFGGDMQFWWWDDGDFLAEMDELYWKYSGSHPNKYQIYRAFDDQGNFVGDIDDAEGYMYSGIPFSSEIDPTAPPVNQFSKDSGSLHTYEIQATLEKELLPDLGVALNASWRRYDNYTNDLNYWYDDDGSILYIESADMYEQGYPLPVQIPEEEMLRRYDWDLSKWDGTLGDQAANEPWYFLTDDYMGTGWNADSYTQYEVAMPAKDYWREWMGLDLIVNKRFSNKWMLNASATIQKEKNHGVGFFMGDTDLDKTNAWALDGRPYSGWTYSRWMVKVSGLYQLPLGFNISGFFTAREGFKENASIELRNRWYAGPYNYRDRTIDILLKPYRSLQHPTFYKLDLRLEKMIRIGDRGKAYIMADAFNILNKGIILNTTGENWGRYYYYGPGSSRNFFRPYSHPDEVNDVLSPFIIRFGVRFEF